MLVSSELLTSQMRPTAERFNIEVITKARVVLHDPSPEDKKQKPQTDWVRSR